MFRDTKVWRKRLRIPGTEERKTRSYLFCNRGVSCWEGFCIHVHSHHCCVILVLDWPGTKRGSVSCQYQTLCWAEAGPRNHGHLTLTWGLFTLWPCLLEVLKGGLTLKRDIWKYPHWSRIIPTGLEAPEYHQITCEWIKSLLEWSKVWKCRKLLRAARRGAQTNYLVTSGSAPSPEAVLFVPG